MNLRSRRDKEAERERLADELAEIKAELKALRRERDNTQEVTKLQRDIEKLKLEKDRLVEDNDRKIRETEHKTGLLRIQQEHEVANAKRETELSVREENLAADKKWFADEMKFQREHLQREVNRIEDILGKILERLPVIDVELSGPAGTRKPSSRSAKDGD